jgi:2-amino-4-hydroxy-6-hydroxymethyldihydropteridine diphosphokinase
LTAPRRRALVLVGSNVRAEVHLPAALRTLRRLLRVGRVSASVESEAVGSPGAPRFRNFAVLVEDAPTAAELRRVLRAVEASHGRRRSPDRNAPRSLDLDVLALAHGRRILPGPDVPGDIGLFHHAAVPAATLAPRWRLPSGRSLADAARLLGPPPAGFRRL